MMKKPLASIYFCCSLFIILFSYIFLKLVLTKCINTCGKYTYENIPKEKTPTEKIPTAKNPAENIPAESTPMLKLPAAMYALANSPAAPR